MKRPIKQKKKDHESVIRSFEKRMTDCKKGEEGVKGKFKCKV